MLSAGQSAGNILHPSFSFVSAKRERKGGSQLAATVEVKRRNRNIQLPYWPNEVSSCLLRLENTVEI
jgi:hypothetical protein